MNGLRRSARVLFTLWWLQLKIVAVSAFDGILNVIYPLVFATTAFLMFGQSGNPEALVYAGLGAAVMGTWSAMATSASGALQSTLRPAPQVICSSTGCAAPSTASTRVRLVSKRVK